MGTELLLPLEGSVELFLPGEDDDDEGDTVSKQQEFKNILFKVYKLDYFYKIRNIDIINEYR